MRRVLLVVVVAVSVLIGWFYLGVLDRDLDRGAGLHVTTTVAAEEFADAIAGARRRLSTLR